MSSRLPAWPEVVRQWPAVARRVPGDVPAVAALVGLWCVFLWTAFGADRSFALSIDNEFLLGPLLSSMSATIAHGTWPLRMDTVLGGVPLYNLTQLSPLYPFYLVALPIYGGPIDAIYSMHWIVLAHLLVLEINTYVFLRVVGASRPAAVTGAALVAFSANSFAYAIWINIAAPYSWLPLYLAGVAGILAAPHRIRYSAMALAGIVLLTLASPAQPLIHAIVMTIVFVAASGIGRARSEEAALTRAALRPLAGIAALAVLLAAPVLLPAVLEFKDMTRWIGPFGSVSGYARIPFDAFQIDQLSLADLGGVLFKFAGRLVGSQFVGIVTIALAAVAVASRPRSWIVAALAFVAVYAIASSAGSNLGLAYVNYNVPFLNKIREPGRFLVLFQFAVGTLAAIGLDELRRTVAEGGARAGGKPVFTALGTVAAFAVAVPLVLPDRIVAQVPPLVSLAVFGALILLTWGAARHDFRGRGSLVAAAWAGAALVLLTLEVSWHVPEVAGSEYLRSETLALDRALERVAARDPDREYRVIFDGTVDKQRAAMLASYRGVRTLNAYINPAPRRQFDELYYHGPQGNNYMRALGAKYLICGECAEETARGYRHVESVAGYDLYEADDVLPRRYVVHRRDGEFRNLGDFKEQAAAIKLREGMLFVEPGVTLPPLGAPFPEGDAACTIRELARTVIRERLVVRCAVPGVLVLNEFFDTAWHATVNGTQTPTLKVNGNQIGVPVGAGGQIVEFRYRPVNAVIGFLLALCAAAGLLFALACAVLGRARGSTQPDGRMPG